MFYNNNSNGLDAFYDLEDFEYADMNSFSELSIINFIHPSDSYIYRNVYKMISPDDVAIIVCHGNPYELGVKIYYAGHPEPIEVELSLDTLSNILLDSKSCNGEPITLLACEACKEADGIAQQLARTIKTIVVASKETVFINDNGLFYASPDKISDNDDPILSANGQFDYWEIFYP